MSRYRIRCTFSTKPPGFANPYPAVSDGQYVILCASTQLMGGRTFCRDDAEAICEALEEAAELAFDELTEA